MKRLTALILAAACVLTLASCGPDKPDPESAEPITPEQSETVTEETSKEIFVPDFNPDDITWELGSYDHNGVDTFGVTYTNNSPYTVTRVEVRFELKEELTEEEALAFEIYSEEEMAVIFISGYNPFFALPSEEVDFAACEISASGLEVTNPVQMGAVEPVSVAVYFLNGEGSEIKTEKNLITGEIATNVFRERAHFWADSELSALIPEPEGDVVTSSISFKAFHSVRYGADAEYFGTYIDGCIAAGFDKEAKRNDYFYGATDGNGNWLRLYYFPDYAEIDINLDSE